MCVCVCVCVCIQSGLIKENGIRVIFKSFIISFKRHNNSFDVTILKDINNFSKRPIYSKPNTFGSYPNDYQGKVHICLNIKTELLFCLCFHHQSEACLYHQNEAKL